MKLMDIAALQGRLRDFVERRDWNQFHSPKNLAMALASEVGELVELFQWLTEEQSRMMTNQPALKAPVAEELADIFIYSARMADVLQIDLERAIESKLGTNERRYPIHLSRGNAVKYSKRGSTVS
jgi:dCTP diphosphatase